MYSYEFIWYVIPSVLEIDKYSGGGGRVGTLINKHKSDCMMDRETNIRAHYVILYDVIIYRHA